jgi:tagatose 6-phosphate kinase
VIICVCLSPALDVTYRVARLEPGATNRVLAVVDRPGGKAVNVARVLHTIGTDVRVLAPVGGATGAEFGSRLAELGVPLEAVPSAHDTRRTITVVDEAGAEPTVFAEPAAIDCWAELVARAAVAMAASTAVVISGLVPVGAPANAMSTLVALARAAGVPVVVDTSGPALLDALSAGPTMVKPNAAELAEATGDGDPARAARVLAQTYDTIVVASLGADGLIAASPGPAWRATPARALRGNPTGAGDALVAGLVRGLCDRRELPDLLADAVALAGAAVLHPQAGEIDPAEVGRQRAGVLVRELDAVR